MNVYEKLNKARILFQEKGLKQNGKNTFANYSYFELFDILPTVNRINEELKCTCVIRFEKDIACLDFINCEKPDEIITFTSPMSEANLRGCHAVQNLGAVQSYLKRYLYQNCFEIAESDVLDKTMNPKVNSAYNLEKLKELLLKHESSITQDVKDKCNNAIKGNGSVDEMLVRLQKYLSTKGVQL